ncbi:MAG TPA: flagellar motor protein MotB, partial [Kaistiaceae bacterium]|nr:flagellar motor protein MotB [Kaistiaceae bacterium]
MAKKQKCSGGGGAPDWLVTFADLMSLLVCFFVLIISFSIQDKEKLQVVAGSMREAFGVQTEQRFSGIIESDGLPTRPKLKNAAQIQPEDA